MAFTELVTTAIAREERLEYDFVVTPGQTLAVTNVDFSYGEVQYWGVFMALGYELLGGTPNIYRSLPLYVRSHTMQFTADGLSVDLQPSVYCPKHYRLPFLTLRLWLWED